MTKKGYDPFTVVRKLSENRRLLNGDQYAALKLASIYLEENQVTLACQVIESAKLQTVRHDND